jgi:hypothetical protein
MSEAVLQTHCAKLLYAYGRNDICWFAVPNGEKRSLKTAARLKQQGVLPGAADICFVIDHLFHGVELKTEIGKMSKVQHQFKEDCERAGGHYHVAFGLEQAVKVLIDIEAFRPNIHINTANLVRHE